MYPEKLIYDIAALPAVKGRDVVRSLVEQAAPYDPVYLLDQEAQQFERRDDGTCQVTTSTGTVIRCGAVVVTGGIGTFTPRPLPAGTDHLGRGLAYFVPDPTVHAGADVVVVGGGDSALDWALMLEPIASSVTLVHRRTDFRAHAATVAAARGSGIRIVTDAQVADLHGDPVLERAVIRIDGRDGPADEVVACSAVIAALGFKANLGPLRHWGAELHDNRHLVVDSSMRTDVEGLYAAGDITDFEGKVRLISVGFGEVATAVNNAAVFIDPAAALFPGHSSDLETPVLVPA
jgi:thioredoxin reductase